MAWATPPTAIPGATITHTDANVFRDCLNETAPAKVTTAGDFPYGTGANALARLAIGSALQELIVNSGATAPQWFTRPAARAYVSGAQQVATANTIAFDAEEFDNDTIHDNSTNNDRLTCKTAGRYHIVGKIGIDVWGAGTFRQITLLKNGGGTNFIDCFPLPNATYFLTLLLECELVLAVNDYLQLYFTHDTGGNMTLLQGQEDGYFSMSWMGPS